MSECHISNNAFLNVMLMAMFTLKLTISVTFRRPRLYYYNYITDTFLISTKLFEHYIYFYKPASLTLLYFFKTRLRLNLNELSICCYRSFQIIFVEYWYILNMCGCLVCSIKCHSSSNTTRYIVKRKRYSSELWFHWLVRSLFK